MKTYSSASTDGKSHNILPVAIGIITIIFLIPKAFTGYDGEHSTFVDLEADKTVINLYKLYFVHIRPSLISK